MNSYYDFLFNFPYDDLNYNDDFIMRIIPNHNIYYFYFHKV